MPVKFMVQIQVSKQILIKLGKHATHEFQTEKICNTFQMKLLAFDIGDIIETSKPIWEGFVKWFEWTRHFCNFFETFTYL